MAKKITAKSKAKPKKKAQSKFGKIAKAAVARADALDGGDTHPDVAEQGAALALREIAQIMRNA